METGVKEQKKPDNQAHHSDNPNQEEGTSSELLEKLRNEISELSDELERAKLGTEENRNLYLRALADADNARKRGAKELEAAKAHTMESFFKELLPVLDSFDNAISANTKDQDGIRLVDKQLIDLTKKHGLSAIDAVDTRFDHNLHMAIKTVESDENPADTVIEQYQKGYLYKDRLLRPAMVCVSKKAEMR